MQIKIDLKICFVLIIFFISNQLGIYFSFMLFTILHELGHLFTGMMLGFKPKGIALVPIGLSICFHINNKNYNEKLKSAKIITLKKLIISLAGPFTNFIIAILCMFWDIEIFNITKQNIIYINLLIACFNLIPIYPLDGGRIIKAIIHIRKDLKKSYKYTNVISNITLIIITVISSIAILYLENIAILLIVIYLWILVIRENTIYNRKVQIYKLIDNLES